MKKLFCALLLCISFVAYGEDSKEYITEKELVVRDCITWASAVVASLEAEVGTCLDPVTYSQLWLRYYNDCINIDAGDSPAGN